MASPYVPELPVVVLQAILYKSFDMSNQKVIFVLIDLYYFSSEYRIFYHEREDLQ